MTVCLNVFLLAEIKNRAAYAKCVARFNIYP
jgi:hypothetical protein